MAKKFTPIEPWHYQEESDAYTHIVRGPTNEHIVQLSQDTSGKAESRARLIATAPDGHNLAQLIVEYFGDEPIDTLLNCDIRLRKAALDLIAKAKGGR